MQSAKYWIHTIRQRLSQPASASSGASKLESHEIDEISKVVNAPSAMNDPDVKALLELLKMLQNMQKSKNSASAQAPAQLPASVSGFAPVPAAQVQAAPAQEVFRPDQMSLLKMQIMAFRYISKNVPVPIQVQQALLALSAAQKQDGGAGGVKSSGTVAEVVAEATIQKHISEQQQQGQVSQAAGAASSEEMDPYAHLKNASRFTLHRLLIPSIMPQGLDPISLAQERERRIRNKISFRIAELEATPANLSTLATMEGGQDLKVKALLELKMLRLVEKQKRMRAEVISGMKNVTTLQTAVSRADYRRLKKPSLRDLKYTEKMERQHRLALEQKEKSKKMDYLNRIVQHGKELKERQRLRAAKGIKMGRAVLNWHGNVEKEEVKKRERVAKERIRALKADDEEGYMKLLDKQKDTRLTHLLAQTDEYLGTLSSLVVAQQADVTRKEGAAALPQPPTQPTADDDGDKTDYYGIAHRVKEVVTEQPSMLVGGKLKEYQIKGLEWMVSLYNNKLNGILADEMGLGKTIQTISLITFLIEKKNQNGPFLVIVPLSTITNWSLEFEKWAPAVSKVVYKGTPNQRRSIQLTEMRHPTFNVVLTTYEYVIKDKAFLSKYKWIHTIIDEGHRMKNAESKLSVTLCQYYSTRYRLILTGTPLQNNLPELWALLNFVLPKIFNSVKTFDDWFNTPFASTGEKVEVNEEEQLLIIKRLHKVLRPFLLRRLKKEVEKDLPDKTERVLKTPMSAIQQKLYSQVRQSGAMMVQQTDPNGKKVSRSINNTIMQLRKICNHPYVFNEVEDVLNPNSVTDVNIVRVSGKFELLDRILPKFKETGHRVLIFFQMTAVMDIMEDFLRWRNLKYMRLDGSTKTEDRSAMLKLFNAADSDYFVFILSTRAGGLGLNLQTADTVIIFDSDWNPHQDLQAQDRAHRIGQTKEVRIFRLISANSIEETILARAQYKLDIDGKVIQAGKFDNKSTNEERDDFLRGLFEGNPEENAVAEDVDEDDELNEILARNQDEMLTFKRMDEQRLKSDAAYWRSMNHSGSYPRLMQLDELPEIYMHDFVPDQKVDVTVDYGRGQRQRADVRYDDGLSEDQWAKAIDTEQDLEAVIARKRERLEKKLAANGGVLDGDEDDDSDDDDQDLQQEEVGGKRGRDEDVTGSPSKKIKIVNPPAPVNQHLSPESLKLKQIFLAAYKAVEECTTIDEDGNERYCSDLFMELPSRKAYPDYYEIVKNPIALDIIQKKIEAGAYKDVQAFKMDFEEMFGNARVYNQEGSVVWQDAGILKMAFESELNKHL